MRPLFGVGFHTPAEPPGILTSFLFLSICFFVPSVFRVCRKHFFLQTRRPPVASGLRDVAMVAMAAYCMFVRQLARRSVVTHVAFHMA